MNLSKRILIKPLNEADTTSKYGLSSATVNSVNLQNKEIDDAFNNIAAPNSIPPQENQLNAQQGMDNTDVFGEDPANGQTSTQPIQDAPTDDPTSVADDTMNTGDPNIPNNATTNTNDPSISNPQGDINQTGGEAIPEGGDNTDVFSDDQLAQDPGMDIGNFDSEESLYGNKELHNLSDKEYQLCNIRIFDQFRELQNKADSLVTSDIKRITPSNPRISQALNIVHENLNNFINDIDSYLRFNFSETYEVNLQKYLLFAKRIKTVIATLKKIKKENAKYDD